MVCSFCVFDNYNYRYTGHGDRVQQTVNGVTTTYVLDLNAGLTQVLSDGSDTYLYGLSRIGEEDAAWDYYLGDALGSVRQLTDATGAVTLAQTYQPYGEVWSSYGEGESNFSYSGEALDASGLIFLRARYMDPGLGRFITRDTWGGVYEDPLSLNRWMYTLGNPVNYTDPSGYCGADKGFGAKQRTEKCKQMVSWIESAYNLTIYWPGRSNLPVGVPSEITCFCMPGICENISMATNNVEYKEWKLKEVTTLGIVLVMYQNEMGSNGLKTMTNNLMFFRGKGSLTFSGKNAAGYYSYEPNFNNRPQITILNNYGYYNDLVWTVIHELAHHLTSGYASAYLQKASISEEFEKAVWGTNVNPGTGPTNYARTAESSREDLADSITTYVWSRQKEVLLGGLPQFQKVIFNWAKAGWNDLDDTRIDWVENYFGEIQEMYP